LKSLTIAYLVLSIAARPGDLGMGSGSAAVPAELERALTARDFAALDRSVQAINQAGDTSSVLPALKARLRKPDPGSRRLAAYVLSQIDREAAQQLLPLLVEALRDDEPRVRARVALALGQMGSAAREAVAALGELLNDADPRVRAGAATALGKIGLDARTTIPELTKRLKDPVVPVRYLAAVALGQMGSAAQEAVPPLTIVQATDTDSGVRVEAASALEAIDPPFPVVLHALTAPDPGRRLWAVSVLLALGPKAWVAVPNLVVVLERDEAAKVRAAAAVALGKIGPEASSAGPVLIEALKDRESRVRMAAALALGLLGPAVKGSGAALAHALSDAEEEVAGESATALGNLGPEAEAAVPQLALLLKDRDQTLRRRGCHVLARIGPTARRAAPALVEALHDSDAELRANAARALVSAGPQPGAPLPALLEALRSTETFVRAWAALSLGQIGPGAAEAVGPLLTALQDDEASVRSAVGLALSRIGPPAVPALVKALHHVNPRVRMEAARALGSMGMGSRRALAPLKETLRDEAGEVGRAAAGALGQIAQGLQLAQQTRSLPDLEDALAALETAGAGRPEPEWALAVTQIRQAVRALETVRRASAAERLWHNTWFPWLVGALLYLVVVLAVWSVLLWRRPLVLLQLNEAFQPIARLPLPSPLGGLEISLRGLLLLRLFHYHPRVLDAWVARRRETFRKNFLAQRTVKDRTAYVPAPVVLDGQVVAGLAAEHLRPTFDRQRACLLVWGEGGAGKTTLACQMASWALADDPAERLCDHIMLPVLIEHELDVPTAQGKSPSSALTEAVRGHLQALLGEANAVPADFCEQLLRQRRILVLIDHLSEVGPATRALLRPGQPDFPAQALVVTSRCEEELDGVPRSVIQLLRIEGNRVSSFLEAYLVQRGKRHCFDATEYFEACRRLAVLAGTRALTVLLAKLYAEQLIGNKECRPQDALPTNLPDLMLGYLNELNRAVAKEQRRRDFEVQRDAEILAWECLRPTLRPAPAGLDEVLKALGGEDAQLRLFYLEEQLKIIRIDEPTRDRVSFSLDPLAEYLAALHLVHMNRDDASLWQAFLDQAAIGLAERETVRNFLLALRESCLISRAAVAVPALLDKLLLGAGQAA